MYILISVKNQDGNSIAWPVMVHGSKDHALGIIKTAQDHESIVTVSLFDASQHQYNGESCFFDKEGKPNQSVIFHATRMPDGKWETH